MLVILQNQKFLNQISDSPGARTHKVLKINDEIMITNSELRPNLMGQYPDLVGGLKVFDISDQLILDF